MAVASEKYFPFDSDDINGQYTREYLADDFARYFRAFIGSGTFMGVPDNLQVIANGDMTVTLRPGSMIIDGYRYDNVADIIIPITPPDGVLSRIDRISATWSNPDDDIHYTLQEGDFSYNPVPPACRRTADYKDYVVADIMVTAGAISIKQSDITDQRLNSEVCGLAVPFGNLDTAALYDQIKADLQYFREMGEEKFTAWFEQIRNQLTEDAAGNLQSQIGNLDHLLTVEKMDLVSALNEICRRVNSSSEMLQKTIGDAFSEEKTYSIGDYAIYENTLYRFIAAKTAGAWNPAAAEAVTVAGELDKLNGNMILDYANAVTLPIKNNISATISTKGMLFPYNFRYSGEGSPYANIHINNSHIAIVNFNSAGREMPGPFPVSPGDMVKITISGGSAEHMTSDWKLVPCKNNN